MQAFWKILHSVRFSSLSLWKTGSVGALTFEYDMVHICSTVDKEEKYCTMQRYSKLYEAQIQTDVKLKVF